MARPPLTLAALATAAVPGLDVRAVRVHTRNSHAAYDAVRLRTDDGRELIIRAPRDQAAETEQSAELIALNALTDGVRGLLPFDAPRYVGQAPIDGTRAVVTEFVPGAARSADELTEYSALAESVGLAIAAIHNLPTAFIADAGLGRRSPDDVREAVVALIDRAADTGHLPAALLRRWEQATDDDALWRFQPTVVHGQLGADAILVDGDSVTGVLGWSQLSQGDPAVDLHWLLTARGAAAERALEAYLVARAGGADPHIPQRALLYGELELARWLLHGVDQHDEATIVDAVALLDGLVASVHDHSSEPLSPETGPIMTVGDVERMLDRTPQFETARDPAATLLTDSYDFSELRRRTAGGDETDDANLTAPIPLDLSDWGDAAPAQPNGASPDLATQPDTDAAASDPTAESAPADDSAEAHARRNSASS